MLVLWGPNFAVEQFLKCKAKRLGKHLQFGGRAVRCMKLSGTEKTSSALLSNFLIENVLPTPWEPTRIVSSCIQTKHSISLRKVLEMGSTTPPQRRAFIPGLDIHPLVWQVAVTWVLVSYVSVTFLRCRTPRNIPWFLTNTGFQPDCLVVTFAFSILASGWMTSTSRRQQNFS